jgi:DNA-binding CsgD family transcriptional regulator/tetratricopeptide (TPR) repeat protein
VAIDDPDERARHLALSIDEPDAAAASVIADAASRASAGAAPEVAVQLLVHAIRLTPHGSTEELSQRTLAIAEERFRIGDPAAASDAVRAAALEPRGPRKAVALATAGRIERLSWRFTDARTHLEDALGHVSDDDRLAGEIHAELFWTFVALGDVVTASDHASIGLVFGRATDDTAARARTYAAAAHARFVRDGIPSDDLQAEAPELWEPIPALPVGSWPLTSRAAELVAAGDLSASRDLIEGLLGAAEEHGEEPSRISLLALLASIDLDEGRWASAAASARLAIELSGADYRSLEPLATCAWLEAMMGERAAAMQDIARGLELVAHVGVIAAAGPSLGRLATAELMLDGAAGASDALIAMLPATPPPERHWFDAADVLIALGRYDEASALTATLEKGADLRPIFSGLGARVRGALAAARGDLSTAEASFGDGWRRLSTMPFEQARTALELGSVRRRLAHKREAREALDEARATFERLGAVPWMARVDEELGHITGRRPSKGTLTDAEMRVARLAASGLRNREIAEQLVMSVRTVEGHLSNVYAKIGVRSRTELVLFFDDPADE